MPESSNQLRKQKTYHSGIHNLSQIRTSLVSSLQITSDHAKKHHGSYLVGQQCQTPQRGQVDESQDSAMKVPSVGGGRRDASGYKQGGVGEIRQDGNLPNRVHNKFESSATR